MAMCSPFGTGIFVDHSMTNASGEILLSISLSPLHFLQTFPSSGNKGKRFTFLGNKGRGARFVLSLKVAVFLLHRINVAQFTSYSSSIRRNRRFISCISSDDALIVRSNLAITPNEPDTGESRDEEAGGGRE